MLTQLKRILAVLLVLLIALPFQSTVLIVYAQSATPGSGDLSSTEKTESAALHGEFGTAAINVGGNAVHVTPESMLTPAELAALTQVLTGGQQTLHLNEMGAAVAGQLSLHSDLATQISNLVIPAGVTALHDAAFMQSLNLNENLTNFGSLFAYSTNANVASATYSASNIYNNVGATLSSILPTSLGITSAVSNLNLSLNAVNSIVNAGTISSSGNLTLSAASIVNSGVMQSMMNMTMTATNIQNMTAASLVAQQTMNLSTANMMNAGLMQAMSGALNIANSAAMNPLNVLNQNGTMKALAGSLSLRSDFDLNVTGGNFSGNTIDLWAPNGNLQAHVDSFSGPIYIKAGQEIGISTTNPDIVTEVAGVDVTGDYFFSSPGSTTQAGGTFTGNPYTVLSGGSITLSGAIDANEVYLISGASYSGSSTVTVDSQTGSAAGITLGNNSITGTAVHLLAAGDVSSNSTISAGAGDVHVYANGNIDLTEVTGGNIDIKNASTDFSGLSFDSSTGAKTGGAYSAGSLSSGNLSTNGAISGTNVILESAGNIQLAHNITGTSSVSIAAHSAANIVQTLGTVSGGTVNLSAGASLGSSTHALMTSTAYLTASAGASAYLNNDMATTLSASSAGGTFSLTNGGALAVAGDLSAATVDLIVCPAVTVNSGVTVASSGNLTVTTSLLSNSGTITSTGNSAIVLCQDCGSGLTLTGDGNGVISATGSGSPTSVTIQILVNSVNALNIDASMTISSTGSSASYINATQGSINLAAGQTLTANINNFNMSSPNITVGTGASITNTGSTSFYTTTLNNSGSISTSGSGNPVITIAGAYNPTGSLTLTGTNGVISALNGVMTIESYSAGGSVNFNSSSTLSSNSGVNIFAHQLGSSINFAADTTTSINGGVNISSPSTNVGTNATVAGNSTINMYTSVFNHNGTLTTSSSNIAITGNYGSGNLTLSGTPVDIVGGNTVYFRTYASGSTIDFDGSFSVAPSLYEVGIETPSDGNVTVSSGTTLSALNGHTLYVRTGTLTVENNGAIGSTGLVDIYANTVSNSGTVTTTSTALYIREGWGAGLTLAGDGSNIYSATENSTSTRVEVISNNDLNINSSNMFSATDLGNVRWSAGNALNVDNNTTQTITTGSQVTATAPTINLGTGSSVTSNSTVVSTNNLSMGAQSSINSTGSGYMSVQGHNSGSITITIAADSYATISTMGGAITIAPAAGQSLTFANSVAAGPLAILHLNGADASLSTTGAGVTTINNFVCVACDHDLTVSGNFVNNGGCLDSAGGITFTGISGFTNNGDISASDSINLTTSGNLSVIGTGTLDSPAINFTSTGGSIYVDQGSVLGALNGSAATSIELWIDSDLYIGNLTAQSVNAQAGGHLQVDGDVNMLLNDGYPFPVTMASTSIDINGTITAPNGRVQLYANGNDVLMGLGDSPTGNGAQFYLSEDELNRITTPTLSIGGWFLDGGFLVTGDIDLSNAGFTNLVLSSGGNGNDGGTYTATGSHILMNSSQTISITANDVFSGSISGGNSMGITANDQLTVDGDLHMVGVGFGGYTISLFGNDVDIPGTITSDNGIIQIVPGSDQLMGIGQSAVSNGAHFYLSEADLNNITGADVRIGNWYLDGGFLVTGNVDISGSGIGGLSLSSGGNGNDGGTYTATGSHIQMNSSQTISITANDVFSGSISGGNSMGITANDQLTVDGDLHMVGVGFGGYTISLYGNDIDIPGTVTADAGIIQLVPVSDQLMGIGQSAVSTGAHFYLSEADLNNITGADVRVGNWYLDGGFLVTGNVDISGSGIGGLSLSSGGNGNDGGTYAGTGSTITMNGNQSFSVTANNIYTGSVSAGYGSWTASNQLTVDGNILMTGADNYPFPVTLTGADVDVTATGSVSAPNGRIQVYPNADISMGLGDTAASNGAQFYFSEEELNRFSTPTLSIGGWWFDSSVLVTGDIDLTSADITNLWITSGGNGNDGGNYVATGSTLRMDCDQTLSITAQNINTGNVVAHNPAFNVTTGTLTIDGIQLDSCNLCVTSLDLTDAFTVGHIVGLQTLGYLGGTLQTSGGLAVGGDIVLNPCGAGCDLSAVNVPANVLITFDGFDDTAVNVNLTGSSTSSSFILGGTMSFDGSSGLINVVSDQGGTVMQINGGVLSADGSLTVNVNGDISMSGNMTAGTDMAVSTTANNGSIALAGNMTAGDTMSLSANGSGSLAAGGTLTADSLHLSSSTGDIGTSSVVFASSVDNLTANTDGSVYLYNVGDVNLGASSAGSVFSLVNYGNLTSSGTLTADDITLQAASNGNITLAGNTSSTNLQLYTDRYTGSVTIADGTVHSAGGSMHISTNDLTVGSQATLTADSLLYDPLGQSVLTVNGNIAAVSSITFVNYGTESMTFAGTATSPISVSGDNAVITVYANNGADVLFASAYTFSATGTGSDILVYVSDNLSIGSSNTFNTGDNGIVNITSASTLNMNASQTFNTGSNSVVTMQGTAALNLNADNIFNVNASSTVNLLSDRYTGEVSLADGTTQSTPGFLYVSTNGLDVGNGATLNGESVLWDPLGQGLLTNNGNISATSSITFTYYGNDGMTLSGTPDSAVSVSANNGAIALFTNSGADVFIDSDYAFAATGNNSTIQFLNYNGGDINLNGSTSFTTGTGGNVTVSADCDAAINVAAGTTQSSSGSGTFLFTTGTLNLGNSSTIAADGNITLRQDTMVNNGANVTTTGQAATISVESCCTQDLLLAGTGGNFTTTTDGSTIQVYAGGGVTVNSANTFNTTANSSVLLGSYFADTYLNAAQTFNTGDNSSVNLVGGYYGGSYDGSLFVGASNQYNVGDNSTVYFSAGDAVEFAAQTTQSVPDSLVVRYGGGAAWGGPEKHLILNTGASLEANTILVEWNTVLGGNFTMNSDDGSLNANESIAFDFCCYYQPTATTFNFNGTASMNVANDNGLIAVGSWCCSVAEMNFNGDYNFNAIGADSDINIFLGSDVNLNSNNTYTVGDNGTIFVGSYYTDMNINQAQTFNTGTNSTVTISGGAYGGLYDGSLNVNVSNDYNLGTGSSVDFRGGGVVEFAAGTTQDVEGALSVTFFGGTTSGYSDKDLVLGTGAQLNADSILVQWNSVGGGTFTMTADGASLTADESINFDFCCYYQPTPNTFNFEGTSTLTVTGDNGLIQAGSWCCSSASMNLNGEYDFTASGDGSTINIFLGDQVNLNGANTFTVGNGGSIDIGSLYTTTTVNASQTFNAGDNSEVMLHAGTVVNLNASSSFNTGEGSTVDVTTGCVNGAINVAASTTQSAVGADSFEFTTYALTINDDALITSTGDITLAQHEFSMNNATVISSGPATSITVLNCCTSDLVLSGSGGTFSANGATTFSAAGALNVNADTAVLGDAHLTAGGDLNLNANLTVSDTTNLNASGNVNQAEGYTVSTPTLDISAGGSIGFSDNAFDTDALNVTANAIGDVYIFDSGPINLGQSSGDTFVVNTANSLTVVGTVTGNNVTLDPLVRDGGVGPVEPGLGGFDLGEKSITLNADVIGYQSVTLLISGTGNIEQNSGLIQTPVLVIQAGSGNIGTSDQSINTNASSLTANTEGNVYVNVTNSVSLEGSSAGGTFNLSANGDMNVNGGLTAVDAVLTTSAVGADINLNSNVTADNSVTLTTNGCDAAINNYAILTAGTAGVSGTITLNTATVYNGADATISALGPSGLIDINCPTCNTTVGNDGSISSTGGIAISSGFGDTTVGGTGSTSAGTTIALTAVGSVNAAQASFAGDLGGSAGNDFSVFSNDSLSTGNISATNVNLGATTDLHVNGSVNAGYDTSMNAGLLDVNGAVTAGNDANFFGGTIDIDGSILANNDANLFASGEMGVNQTVTAGHDANLFAGGDLNIQESVSADNNIFGDGNDLNVNSNLSAGNNTTLSAFNNITQAAGTLIDTVSLDMTAGGNIGTGTNNTLTSATELTANAGGSAFIDTTGPVNLGASSAGSTFDLDANGDMNINDGITAADVALTTSFTNADMHLNSDVTADNSVTISTTGCDALLTNNADLAAGTATNSGTITLNTANVDNSIGATIAALGPGGSIDINCLTCNTTVANDGSISSTGDLSISSGFDVSLSGSGSTTAADDITVSAGSSINLNANTSAGDTTDLSAGTDVTQGNGYNISTTTLDISAGNSIGSSTNALDTDADNLTANAGTDMYIDVTGSVTVSNSSAGDLVELASTGTLTTEGQLSAGTDLTLVAGTGALVDDLAAGDGTISVTTSTGTLAVQVGATIDAVEGDVILLNGDTNNGHITVGAGAHISALSTTDNDLGDVVIVIGTIPVSPANGVTPANVTDVEIHGGHTYYGNNGLTANQPSNTVTADGGDVIFDSGNTGAGGITLDGNVLINATAPASNSLLLTSLDLTDPNVTALILQMQGMGIVGGSLQVNGSGVATGGNAIITADDLAPTLTAQNIPTNVTLSMLDFGPTNLLDINITGTSTTTQVRISGTQQFIGNSAQGNINIASTQAGPVLSITGTGLLTSNDGLAVNVNGNVLQAGTMSATNNLSLTVAAGSTVTNTGTIAGTSGNVVMNTGNLANNGLVTAANNFNVNHGQSITVSGTGTVTGTNGLAFNSTNGAVQVCQNFINGAVSGTAATSFTVGDRNSSLTVGSISAPVVNLASGTGSIIFAAGGNVNTSQPGGILNIGATNATINSGTTISAENIFVSTNSLTNNGTLQSTTGNLTITNANPTSGMCDICGINIGGHAGGSLTVNNNGLIDSQSGQVSIKQTGNYALTITNAGTMSSEGDMNLQAMGTGAFTTTNSGLVSSDAGTVYITGNGGAHTVTNNGTVDGHTAVNITQTNNQVTISNNGTITSDGTIAVTATKAVSLTGTGTLDASNINLNSTANSYTVTLCQNVIEGAVGGSAKSNFIAAARLSDLDVGNISAPTIALGSGSGEVNFLGNTSATGSSGKVTVVAPEINVSAGALISAKTITLITNDFSNSGNVQAGSSGLTITNVLSSSNSTVCTTCGFTFTPSATMNIANGGTLASSSTMTVTGGSGTTVDFNNSGNITSTGTFSMTNTGHTTFSNAGTLQSTNSSVSVTNNNGNMNFNNTGVIDACSNLTIKNTSGTLSLYNDSVLDAGQTLHVTNTNGDLNVTNDHHISGGTVKFTTTNADVHVTGTGVLAGGSGGVTVATSTGSNAYSVDIDQNRITGNLMGTSGGWWTAHVDGPHVTLGTIQSYKGGITIVVETGSIYVAPDAIVKCGQGNTTLQTNDLANGTIDIGVGANVEAWANAHPWGNLILTIGSFQQSDAVEGTRAANTTIIEDRGGNIYWGEDTITSLRDCEGNGNSVRASGSNVYFNTGGRDGSIILRGNTTLIGDPPAGETEEANQLLLLNDQAFMQGWTDLNTVLPDVTPDPPAEEPVLEADSPADGDSSLVPIAFTPSTAPGLYTLKSALGETYIKHAGDANISEHQSGELILRTGEILVTAASPLSIKAGAMVISLQPGVIALISRKGQQIAARGIHGHSKASMRIFADGLYLDLHAGEEVVLGNCEGALNSCVKSDGIGRRKVHSYDLGTGRKLMRAEVSLLTLAEKSRVIRQVCQSKEGCDRVIKEKLLKTAAALHVVTSSHGPYDSK